MRLQVGDAEIMRRQPASLTELAELAHLSIRIVPFTGGLTYGMQISFVLMRFPDPLDRPVLYFEAPRGSAVIFEDETETDRYDQSFSELQQRSLSERKTVQFLRNLDSEHD